MNLSKCCFTYFLIFITILFLVATNSFSKDEDTSFVNTLYQIKYVIKNRFTSKEIVNMVEQARRQGATGYIVVPPLNSFTKDMGWLIEDSKGREVFRVLFTFDDNGIVNNGRYLGPLISNVQQIHQLHVEMLSRNYKLITPGSYDIGDGCRAIIKIFKSGVSDPGRTVITVECLN